FREVYRRGKQFILEPLPPHEAVLEWFEDRAGTTPKPPEVTAPVTSTVPVVADILGNLAGCPRRILVRLVPLLEAIHAHDSHFIGIVSELYDQANAQHKAIRYDSANRRQIRPEVVSKALLLEAKCKEWLQGLAVETQQKQQQRQK